MIEEEREDDVARVQTSSAPSFSDGALIQETPRFPRVFYT